MCNQTAAYTRLPLGIATLVTQNIPHSCPLESDPLTFVNCTHDHAHSQIRSNHCCFNQILM